MDQKIMADISGPGADALLNPGAAPKGKSFP